MIPPANVIPDNSVGKENDRDQHVLPQSPSSSISQQESKLQKLKRSLSFKTKSLRSKSADNFFQRANSDVRLQVDLLPQVSVSVGHLSASDLPGSAPPPSRLRPLPLLPRQDRPRPERRRLRRPQLPGARLQEAHLLRRLQSHDRGHHHQTWPPMQSLQNEHPSQVCQRRGPAAMHGETA
ncbi:hypothetical protein ANANG_G00004670 [Anguilla anguilla]|uniref:Uncharacterized protein n=1 Tax=Anguilla anguilla TaxID=7936 RepID=A0A9D3SAP0_ANGAN|nr:hypothetical protein ANANG_G00004670 [Anguilla anguilla]